MARILLIEDEDNIRKIIAYDLKKADFDIVECGDGRTAVDLAMKEDFDVLIIDWMLPHVSGIDIVKKLRSEHIDAIFIMLTARDDETDILYAFEQGVDDYITKPFSPRELLARVNAHLKRQNRKQEKRLDAGGISMIWKRHLTLDELNATSDNTMVAHLGIVYTRLGDDVLEAEMPVDTRTHQPFGLLHGGASAALAETLGSMAGFMMTRDGQCVVGTELNATHHRPVSEGKVRGVCQPLHLGRQNQSWEIVVFDEQGRRCCTCRLGTAVLG